MEPGTRVTSPNGSAVAAALGAAIGAFTMGLVVVLNEAGILAAPSLYGPAGGVSGRTTIAVIIWLGAWVVLHYRLRDREVEPSRFRLPVFALIALGILFTFPPFWGLIT
jgi:hypothetical protein